MAKTKNTTTVLADPDKETASASSTAHTTEDSFDLVDMLERAKNTDALKESAEIITTLQTSIKDLVISVPDTSAVTSETIPSVFSDLATAGESIDTAIHAICTAHDALGLGKPMPKTRKASGGGGGGTNIKRVIGNCILQLILKGDKTPVTIEVVAKFEGVKQRETDKDKIQEQLIDMEKSGRLLEDKGIYTLVPTNGEDVRIAESKS